MLDLAVGVIIGGAFNSIITSIVNDLIMPILSVFTKYLDFTKLFIALNGKQYESLAAAQADNVATINYGMFLTNFLNFLITAFILFLIVRYMNKLRAKNAKPAEKTTKQCPHCMSEINIKASKCPHCTGDVE